MQKSSSTLIMVAIVALFIIGIAVAKNAARQQSNDADAQFNATTDVTASSTAQPIDDGSYTVAPDETTVAWEGRKTLIENYVDTGTIAVKEGTLTAANGVVTSGTVTFDMTSITAVTVAKGDGQDRLTAHLKSDDFFAVETYPTATFVLTHVVPEADAATAHRYTVTGDLTIKDTTHRISFPAVIAKEDGALRAEATVDIDRTQWGVRFGSDSFFDNLGNNVIDDTFSLAFTLVARLSAEEE